MVNSGYSRASFEKQRAIANAEKKSLILIQHSLAIHSYFNKLLKPKIFSITDNSRDSEFFDPTWMSSTYAVREIYKIYDNDSEHQYYYKEAAITLEVLKMRQMTLKGISSNA